MCMVVVVVLVRGWVEMVDLDWRLVDGSEIGDLRGVGNLLGGCWVEC